MAENNKIPKIRFKEFSDEWKLQKLGKVINLENGFAFKSKYFQDEPTDVIVLTPGSVHIDGGFQRGKGRFYNIEGDFPKKFIFKPNDIFITMTDLTPTAQALGFPAVVPNDGKMYLHNQRLGKLTGFEGDKFFLFQLLSTRENQKKIVLTSSGTTVKHTSPQKVLSCENYYPHKNEQTKIGSYFQELDRLITLHQRKHDELLKVKKAMLEKIFPKKGADVPEIRFKGFSKNWKKRELGEIANRYDNLRVPITATRRVLGITPYYGANGIQGYVEGYTHDGEFILVAEDGANDLKNYPVQYVDGKIWVNNHAHVLQSKKGIADNYFLKITISQTNIEPFLVGGGRAKLNAEIMMKIVVNIPSNIKEQTKIGNFFKNIDNVLSLHKNELEKLKNIKKACLEKMFV